jgi:fused signal recognition particle receptor
MFNKLREKIKDWAKNVADSAEEFEEEAEKSEKLSKKSEKREKKPKKIKVKLEEEPETKGIFGKIGQKINTVKITEEQFQTYSEELENLLLENNVALEVAERITRELRNKIMGKEIMKKEIEEEIKDAFKEIINEILIEPFDVLERIEEKHRKTKEPYVILFCGINGSGKTTTIAKIAGWLKRKGISCVIAASDTFRAASIEQIKEHGEKIGVHVISNDYGVDPASVAFDAIQYAKKNFIQCVLIDTAGRMHTAKNLIKEIEKISRVTKPDLKVFIGESITGNDAVEQVKSFNEAIGIDGIVLTKADIDEKGGTALSLGYVTKKPILYLGTGQAYDAIEPFDKKSFIRKLGL